MIPTYVYRAVVDRIKDGDSYVVAVDLGFRVSVKLPVRVVGVDLPELRTPEGIVARDYVQTLLRPTGQPPTPLVLRSYKDQLSFERWLVDLWLPDGRLLADVLREYQRTVSPA